MQTCVLCGKEIHTVGAIHLVDSNKNVVCEKNNGIRRTHKIKVS